jgi:hypothetical protein
MHVEPRGASLAVQVFDHEDGSSMTGDMFDVASQRPCFPSWIDGVTDDYRCYGATFSMQGGCMVGASGSCDGDIFVEGIGFCTAPTFRRLTKTGCDLFDPVQFPMLASDWLGTGRIRLVVTHASDDAHALFVNPNLFQTYGRYMRGPFFDTERQLTCEPTVLDDGSVRCLTQDVATTNLYSDATCSNLIAEKSGGGTDPCPTHQPPPGNEFVVSKQGRLYKLGSSVYRAQVFTVTGMGCEVLDVGAIFAYDLVTADANIFATLKIETE